MLLSDKNNILLYHADPTRSCLARHKKCAAKLKRDYAIYLRSHARSNIILLHFWDSLLYPSSRESFYPYLLHLACSAININTGKNIIISIYSQPGQSV